ncbi:MAG: S49 family peptidase [Acetobacteraceae bacterium]
MTRFVDQLATEQWAIVPAELLKIAAIVRNREVRDRAPQAGVDFQKRDYQMLAGPRARRLEGAHNAFEVDGVAIIPVMGPIFPRANMMTEFSGATSISTLQHDYRAALENRDIEAILLQVDSPGGVVSGVAAFADTVAAGNQRKATTAHVMGMAASAAYWIASAAGRITLDRTDLVGSIGVVTAVPVQVAPDANGDMWIEIVSSNAPNKRPDPMSEAGHAEILAGLNAIEEIFVADVAKGRKVPVEKVLADFKRGGVERGAAAVKLGMADKVQSYDATLAEVRQAAANQRRMNRLKS